MSDLIGPEAGPLKSQAKRLHLRELLYEPWVDAGPDGRDVVRREALATRLPECVPEGLEWEDGGCCQSGWMIIGNDDWADITDEQATLMCIGRWVQVLGKRGWSAAYDTEGNEWEVSDDRLIEGGLISRDASLPDALAAALHRLADEREA